jgi:DNA-directed RNA polymerase specialized sigma24 family protein
MDLDQALATLPEHARLCIVLSYQEGLSHREIAKLVDMPLGTVKSHINRGTQRLQPGLHKCLSVCAKFQLNSACFVSLPVVLRPQLNLWLR